MAETVNGDTVIPSAQQGLADMGTYKPRPSCHKNGSVVLQIQVHTSIRQISFVPVLCAA